MKKHWFLLIPRLISEWCNYFTTRTQNKKTTGLLRVGDGIDIALYARHGVSSLPLQAIEIYTNQKNAVTNSLYYNGASKLLNRGNPVRIMHDHIENSFHRLEVNDSMDLAGASLISLKKFSDPYGLYPEEVSIALDYLQDNRYNLSTEAAIVLMSLYACCGKGFVWPKKHYRSLFKIYALNLFLKPLHKDYRTIIALYCLAESTNSFIWKVLYRLNSRHMSMETMETYAP